MANTDKYVAILKESDPDFFKIGDTDTEATTAQGVSKLFDYVTKKTSLINSSTSLTGANGFYIVSSNCTITFPVGYDGLTIGLKLTATPTSVPLLPTSPNVFEGGNPTLVTSDIREYCFVSGTWYRIR